MLNSRQKLAEQLLSNETELENPKINEQSNLEKKIPPKLKRPGIRNENEFTNEKKTKVNLDDLLENYEKHELPEADIKKISNCDIKIENLECKIDEIKNLSESNLDKKENIFPKIKEENLLFGNENDGEISTIFNKEPKQGYREENIEKSENLFKNFNIDNNNENKKKIGVDESKIFNEDNQNKNFNEINSKNNIVEDNSDSKERNNMLFGNEDKFEDFNTTSNINLNPSENTLDEINFNNNNINENVERKLNEIGSSTSINPKNAPIFEEDFGSSNNLFESTNSHTKNFFENITGNNVNNINNLNNNFNKLGAAIYLGNSTKTLENENLIHTHINSEKDINNNKTVENIDFNIKDNQENKSISNSENNHISQNEDNISFPEINCKSIELTNENLNDKKHSSTSSNLNNKSNGNYPDTKDFNNESNNLKEEKLNSYSRYNENSRNNISVKNKFNEFSIKTEIYTEKPNEINYDIHINEKEINIENKNNNDLNYNHKDKIKFFEEEIWNLRNIINEYKIKEINQNECMLKLEIVNLKNTVKAKITENELLTNENKNLKNHLRILQENVEIFFSENKNKNKITIIKESSAMVNSINALELNEIKKEKHEFNENTTKNEYLPESK